MVGSVGQGRKPLIPDLFLRRDVKSPQCPQVVTVEDVVQHLLLLARVSDLPGGVVQAGVVIGGVQHKVLVGGESLVDLLAGLGIEVPGEDDRPAGPELLQPGHEVLTLLVPDTGQQRPFPRLQVRRDGTDFLPRLVSEDEAEDDLVSGGLPGGQNFTVGTEQLELVRLEENRAAVRSRVAVNITTGRVGLRTELSGVANAGQGRGDEVVVVDLLETDDVRLVEEDLLEQPPSPAAPLQDPRVRELELVYLSSDRWKYIL